MRRLRLSAVCMFVVILALFTASSPLPVCGALAQSDGFPPTLLPAVTNGAPPFFSPAECDPPQAIHSIYKPAGYIEEPRPAVRTMAPNKPAPPSRISDVQESNGVLLTLDEYKQFQKLLKYQWPTPWDIAWANIASTGSTFLMTFIAMVIALLLIRRVFRELWDIDVHQHPYASAIILASAILATAYVWGSVAQ